MRIQLPGGYHLEHDRFGRMWLLRRNKKPVAFWRRAPMNFEETSSWLETLYKSVKYDSKGRYSDGKKFIP